MAAADCDGTDCTDGKKMNMTTVAEGVETWEDEAFILEAGCDYGRGIITANLFEPLNLRKNICRKKGSFGLQGSVK